MRTGVAHLPLHSGKAPSWLFQRMKKLSREILLCMVDEYGTEEILSRFSDPFWFQAFGCALGFDWHSSGVTTTVCGAVKEGIKGIEDEIGLHAAGGKGKVSRKTPHEIEEICFRRSIDGAPLVYASRMSAKVDSAAVQDGYQIYQHSFFFTEKGSWAVVQQGMNEKTGYARRYHWLSSGVKDFVCEPHNAVCCDTRGEGLNLVAAESHDARTTITELSRQNPDSLIPQGRRALELCLPKGHAIAGEAIQLERIEKTFVRIYEASPRDFEALLGMRGVGPKSLRALSLVSELIYGVRPSFRDPARFSYAHGGKDGHPYFVDRKVYDSTIQTLQTALDRARLGDREKIEGIRRLERFSQIADRRLQIAD